MAFPPKKDALPTAATTEAAAQRAIRPQQSLNEIEEGLRRHYGLVGEIRATLSPSLSPVIVVGDLREPGHAVNRGRSFAWASQPGLGCAAGVTVLSLRFDADVLILGAYVDLNSAAQGFSLYVTAPGETIPIAVTGAGGTWVDRKSGAGDVPPIVQTAAWGALTGTAESNTNRIMVWTQTQPRMVPLQIMLTSGSALTWRSANTQTAVSAGLWGRIFP